MYVYPWLTLVYLKRLGWPRAHPSEEDSAQVLCGCGFCVSIYMYIYIYVCMDRCAYMCTFNKNTDIAFAFKVLIVVKQLLHFDI